MSDFRFFGSDIQIPILDITPSSGVARNECGVLTARGLGAA